MDDPRVWPRGAHRRCRNRSAPRSGRARVCAGKFSLIVTADHGGHGTGHGSKDPRDVTIPWIAWGQGVRQGVLDQSTVRTMDTAATVLWLLGLTEQSDWVGEAVIGAYEPSPVRVAVSTE